MSCSDNIKKKKRGNFSVIYSNNSMQSIEIMVSTEENSTGEFNHSFSNFLQQ